MRSQDEIVARVKELEGKDFFGFQTSDLITYLDFEHAKQFLKDGVVSDQWTQRTPTDEMVLKEMHEYIEFAWEKANGGRGLSAGRSMDHYRAWFWLLGNDEMVARLATYQFYGKDHLVEISKFLGVDPTKYDDGVRVN